MVMRKVSNKAGFAEGMMTFSITSARVAPMVSAASICAAGTRRTSSATIRTI